MATKLYMDVHVPRAIPEQLRKRGVDVLTAWEDDAAILDDDILLDRAGTLDRLIFTQDIRFRAMTEHWQRIGREFAGLAFGHQLQGTIGEYVRDLELIALATDFDEWRNTIVYLPFSRKR